ncbi:MAG: xanthine dehydrogenase family protein molybdopterin-binding subunit [bacterium]|nr:xanthine dehydrogenase family protein molybdopterin-binding subunit [bacterium]
MSGSTGSAGPIPAAARYVGQSVARLEDPRLLTGGGRYVANRTPPGTGHVAFARSTRARARITRLDVTAAAALDGVWAIWTAADLNGDVGSLRGSLVLPGGGGPPDHLLADGDVRFVGDPVAVIVAASPAAAADAVELIEIDYDDQAPVLDFETAAGRDDLVHPELGSNLSNSAEAWPPEVDEAMAGADTSVQAVITQNRQANAPMETRGLLAEWRAFDETLDVWISTQSPHETALAAARTLGLAVHQVRVHMGDVGGAFGQKVFLGREEFAVMVCARRLGRPVRWIEGRSENLTSSNHARRDRADVSLGATADGRFVAATIDHLEDNGAYSNGGSPGNGTMACVHLPGPYRIADVGWRTATVYTNTCGRGAYRGPWQIESVARELIVDMLARELDIDPLELRRRNVLRAGDLPHNTATGLTYDRISPSECLDQVAEMIDYDGYRASQRESCAAIGHAVAPNGGPPDAGTLPGIGLAVYVEPSAIGFGALATEGATVRVEPDGSVNVYAGTGSHGQSLETTMAQIVADALGVHPGDVRFHQGHGTPYGFGTGGSRSAVIAGGAARAASAGVRAKLLRIAAELMEASPDDLDLGGGAVSVRGTPARRMTVAQVAQAAYMRPDALPDDVSGGLEHTARFKAPPVTYSNAAHACTCEVDVATGAVRLLRYAVSEDCGVMINPMVVKGQIAGGVVQGIGGALLEEMAYDSDGNPLTTTLAEYLVPSAAEVPVIEYGHVVTPSDTPGGHKGTGEGGAIGSVPCVFNAVADALAPLSVRLTAGPLSPDRIRAAIVAASG